MTEGVAKQLETDVVIFPMEINRDEKKEILVEEISATALINKTLVKTDLQIRFARLKKSLKKRSAGIL